MRSIQCHLKTTGGFQSHPHLKRWLEESNVLQHQPLQPLKYALQTFTDASKERWGAHLNKHTATGTWSLPESKLYISYLELKAVFFTLNEFCENSRVLIAKDNTTVVAYSPGSGQVRSNCVCPTCYQPFSQTPHRNLSNLNLHAQNLPISEIIPTIASYY